MYESYLVDSIIPDSHVQKAAQSAVPVVSGGLFSLLTDNSCLFDYAVVRKVSCSAVFGVSELGSILQAVCIKVRTR